MNSINSRNVENTYKLKKESSSVKDTSNVSKTDPSTGASISNRVEDDSTLTRPTNIKDVNIPSTTDIPPINMENKKQKEGNINTFNPYNTVGQGIPVNQGNTGTVIQDIPGNVSTMPSITTGPTYVNPETNQVTHMSQPATMTQMPQGSQMTQMPQGSQMTQMPQPATMPQVTQGSQMPQVTQGSMSQMPQPATMPQVTQGSMSQMPQPATMPQVAQGAQGSMTQQPPSITLPTPPQVIEKTSINKPKEVSFGQSVQQIPMQQIPTQQIPTQQIPMNQIPMQQIPTQQVPMNQIPMQQIPTQQVPMQQIPTHQIPINQIPMQQIPMNQIPMNQIPMQQIPTQQVPMNQIPTQQVPMNQIPMQQIPTPTFQTTKKEEVITNKPINTVIPQHLQNTQLQQQLKPYSMKVSYNVVDDRNSIKNTTNTMQPQSQYIIEENVCTTSPNTINYVSSNSIDKNGSITVKQGDNVNFSNISEEFNNLNNLYCRLSNGVSGNIKLYNNSTDERIYTNDYIICTIKKLINNFIKYRSSFTKDKQQVINIFISGLGAILGYDQSIRIDASNVSKIIKNNAPKYVDIIEKYFNKNFTYVSGVEREELVGIDFLRESIAINMAARLLSFVFNILNITDFNGYLYHIRYNTSTNIKNLLDQLSKYTYTLEDTVSLDKYISIEFYNKIIEPVVFQNTDEDCLYEINVKNVLYDYFSKSNPDNIINVEQVMLYIDYYLDMTFIVQMLIDKTT